MNIFKYAESGLEEDAIGQEAVEHPQSEHPQSGGSTPHIIQAIIFGTKISKVTKVTNVNIVANIGSQKARLERLCGDRGGAEDTQVPPRAPQGKKQVYPKASFGQLLARV